MHRSFFLLFSLFLVNLSAAERRVIFPGGAKPVGPYSPGILVGEYLYVSGQGARGPDRQMPATFDAQLRQCLENIKAVVEAAGLTMEHVVYTQAYLTDMANYEHMDPVWRQFFPKAPPARSVMGVYRLPDETPVEISAVAVRDLALKKAIVPPGYPAGSAISPGVMAGERLYLSGFLGREKSGDVPQDAAAQVSAAFDQMNDTLAAAGMDFRHMVFVQPYLTDKMAGGVMNRIYASHFEFGNTPARNTMGVSSLPFGTSIEFTGVAIRDLAQRHAVRPKNMPPSPTASPCVLAGDTLYCSGKSAFIPGPRLGIYASTVEHQLRQTMRNLLDGLEEAGMDFSNVVANYVYLDNIDDFTGMNRVYAQYFSGTLPTRTTVEHRAPVARKADEEDRWPAIEEIALIAVR
ncbi:MAG TPA: RidA family protein [Bryobacteraceae bacterium]|nr:RidA family protein [Bryobacteraceae bacterium]